MQKIFSDHHEKIERSYERLNCATPVLFENFEAHGTLPGTMYNYSKGGMYLVSEYLPQQGSGAQIHMVNYSPEEAGPETLKKYFVQVRWVNKVSETADSNLYGIGVKYCDDVREFVRLFSH